MTESEPKQATAEQRSAADPGSSVWVAANAGSGKTHVLVDRVIRLMLEGAAPETILCLTFTKAAAAEMQNRLFERLSQWTLLSDAGLRAHLEAIDVKNIDVSRMIIARQLFTRALETPGGLKIQTIHAFAEKLLHLFPVEAGIAPGFRVLDDRQADVLMENARRSVLANAQSDETGSLNAAIERVEQFTNVNSFDELIGKLLQRKNRIKDLLSGTVTEPVLRQLVVTALGLNNNMSTSSYKETICNFDQARYLEWANLLPQQKTTDADTINRISAVAKCTSNDSIFNAMRELVFVESFRHRRKQHLTKAVCEEFPAKCAEVIAEIDRLEQAFLAHDMHLRAEATTALLVLGQAILQNYETQKRLTGSFDFADLIRKAAALLNLKPNAQWVLYKIDKGIDHILVDEAQDTSPDQWSIISALVDEFFAGEGAPRDVKRTLFVVGDRKQSIYSFQGADAAGFERIREVFATKANAARREFPPVRLSLSYRSVPEILDVVDAVFPTGSERVMGFETHEDSGHAPFRRAEHGIVEIWPIVETVEQPAPQAWERPIDRDDEHSHRQRLAREIAATVKAWIGRREIAGTKKTVTPGDILILLQKRGALSEMLISELRQAGVPVAGADRLQLRDSLAVQDLLAFGQAMLLASDDYSLACLLKSPLVPHPISEDQLYALARARGRITLWQRLELSTDPDIVENRADLVRTKSLTSNLGPHGLFAYVLNKRRKAMLQRLGPEAKDAADAFLDLALSYEEQFGPSLAGFIAWFSMEETELKREMEAASGLVRLMTVHGSKGLESPIVILPDATLTEDGSPDSLIEIPDGETWGGLPIWDVGKISVNPMIKSWKESRNEKNLYEKKRLLYVAMTRARDELYVCGSKKSKEKLPDNCWYRFVEEALSLQSDKVVFRKVMDRCHEQDVLRHGVDPNWQEAFATQKPGIIATEDWMHTDPPAEKVPSLASVTQRFASGSTATSVERLQAIRTGTMIHLLLQELPDVNPDQQLDYAQRRARRLKIEQPIAQNLVRRLQSDDLKPFLDSGSVAEASVMMRDAQGELLAGRMDRMRVTGDKIYILDFKTHQFPPQAPSPVMASVRQIALYAQALEGIYPGRDVVAAVLWTTNGRLDILTPEMLSRSRDAPASIQRLDDL